jgi:anthranilate synthase component 1
LCHFAGLPRFCGGMVGYLGYDLVRFFEKLPDAPPDDRGLDDCHLLLTETVLVFDAVRHSIKVLNNALIEGEGEDAIRAAYDAACSKIDATLEQLATEVVDARLLPLDSSTHAVEEDAPQSNFASRADFEAAVEKCREYIMLAIACRWCPVSAFRCRWKWSRFPLIGRCVTLIPRRICFIWSSAMCS